MPRKKLQDVVRKAKEGRLTDLPIEPVKKVKEAKDRVLRK